MDPRSKLIWPVIVLSLVTFLSLASYVQARKTKQDPHYPACFEKTGGRRIPHAHECNFECPTHLNRVCGTDGVPYHNECFLCRKACLKPKLHKKCDGSCPCRKHHHHMKHKKTEKQKKPVAPPTSQDDVKSSPEQDINKESSANADETTKRTEAGAEKKYTKRNIKKVPVKRHKQRPLREQKPVQKKKYTKRNIKKVPVKRHKQRPLREQKLVQKKKYTKRNIKKVPVKGHKQRPLREQKLVQKKKYTKRNIKKVPVKRHKQRPLREQKLMQKKK
ncbi:uncharacterized protein [Amphiura filiformis]|uniref:uncharacterized protein n=1 Tax=Amphiura filiformis TaxID=82378 RepID=UPI003B216E38